MHVVIRLLTMFLLSAGFLSAATRFGYVEDQTIRPPAVPREFRAAWIATVANIDWPSKPGLTAAQQQKEMLAILDRAHQLRMNAVILQVRPTADALYPSKIEPWSWYLTGKAGKPPQPYYDPLLFAIREASRRNLEVHAWFNPFRARHPSAKGGVASNHISRRRPDLVRRYGSLDWLDPGDPAVRAHSKRVIMDVLNRYPVDGIHIDDYFYPYPVKRSGKVVSFPDSKTYAKYRRAGGKLKINDWRRDNVNRFVKDLYQSIKKTKPWVKFGISPFGIWRPNHPQGIKGMDAYDVLYADALLWWQLGWVDYLAPQLYWSIDMKEQSFPVLLKWWAQQNKARRHLWPGISIRGTKENRHPFEVLEQVNAVRKQAGVNGHIHYGMNSLLTNRQNVAYYLQKHVYKTAALPPPSPWLSNTQPGKPRMHFGLQAYRAATFKWSASGALPKYWLLQQQVGGNWHTSILPGSQTTLQIRGSLAENLPTAISLTPIDRYGKSGLPFRARRRTSSTPPAKQTPAKPKATTSSRTGLMKPRN